MERPISNFVWGVGNKGNGLGSTEIVAPGQIFIPFHFSETNANNLTLNVVDPISREPNYKQCAVRVERAVSGTR